MCVEVLHVLLLQNSYFPFIFNSFFANKSNIFTINQLKLSYLFEKTLRNKSPVKKMKTCRYCTRGTSSKFKVGQLSPFSLKIAGILTAYITLTTVYKVNLITYSERYRSKLNFWTRYLTNICRSRDIRSFKYTQRDFPCIFTD